MPDAVPNIEEELRKRGLLATGGNIRMLPFSNPSAAADATPIASDSGTGSATANALGVSNGGGVTVNDATGNPITVDPNAAQLPANVPDEEWLNLWPALAGAGGAALAMLIKNHFAGKGVNLPALADEIPTVNATLEPDGVPGSPNIVDGEFTEVADDPRLAAPQKQLSGSQKVLAAPQPKLTDALVNKRLGKSTSNLGTIQAGDSYSDLSPEDMKKAQTIADQLVQRRLTGNQAKRAGKVADLPTGNMDRNGLLNVVVKAIRDSKLKPNQLKKVVGR